MTKKASWGGKSLFGLHFHIIVHHEWKSGQELKQGRNLEAEADAEGRGTAH
jgi:diadenosine tetraphosphate (Ap4A) HIT family hydrolase